MNNKKQTIIITFAIALLMIALVGATYAYFIAQAGGTTSRNINVTSNTTDNLAFQISNDISFTVTQATFAENAGNRDGYATATAILTPNNYTGSATRNYYLYLIMDSNPTVYSEANTNELPELMLQVFDSSNQLVTLTGLGNQVTVGSVTGYDITGVEGKLLLLNNQVISASNNTATTQTWRVVITLINHNFNQNDNTGKIIEGRLEIRKDASPDYVYWNDLFFTPGFGYDNSHKPETTYTSYANMIEGNRSDEHYNSVDYPIFVRTTLVGGNVTGHETCIYYDNQEFCLSADYHVANDLDHSLTRAKLKDDLETTFGITMYDNGEEAAAANSTNICDVYQCEFDDFIIHFAGNGAYIWTGERSGCLYCGVSEDGEARCGCMD